MSHRRGRGGRRGGHDDDWDQPGPDESRRSRGRRSRPAGRGDWDEPDVDDEPEPGNYGHAPKRRARSARDRDEPGGGRPRRGAGLNWGAAEDVAGPGYDDDAPQPRRRRRAVAPAQTQAAEVGLLELCTPVFALARLLPGSAEDAQPEYELYRRQVLDEIRGLETRAAEHAVEPADAQHAAYALCLFIDEQVNASAWSERERWAAEPLHIMLQNDPEGGIHFFERLHQFGEHQSELKAVYLTCLAMGFRGMYAEYEDSAQAQQLMEIREKVFEGLGVRAMQRRRELFPEGYREAKPLEVTVPSGRLVWKLASFVACAVGLLLIAGMWIWSARRVSNAEDALKRAHGQLESSLENTRR